MALIEVRLFWTLAGGTHRASAKMDFESSATPTATQLGTLATAASDAYDDGSDGLKRDFPASVVLDRVQAFTWHGEAILPVPDEAPRYKRVQDSVAAEDGTNVVGVRVGTALPPQNAFVISFRTALAGRRRRGRWYLPPFSEGDVDAAGVVDATLASQAQSDTSFLAQAVEAAVAAINPTNHVVWSSWDNVGTLVNGYTNDGRIDTQRRRLRGV